MSAVHLTIAGVPQPQGSTRAYVVVHPGPDPRGHAAQGCLRPAAAPPMRQEQRATLALVEAADPPPASSR